MKKKAFKLNDQRIRFTAQLVLLAAVLLFICFCRAFTPDPSSITLIVLGLVAVLYVTEFIPLPLTAISIPLVLNLTKVINISQTFSGFSNDSVLLFLTMFIVGGAMFKTGVAEIIGEMIIRLARGSEKKAIVYIMIATALISSVMSNTGTVAVLLPVCVGIADTGGFKRINLLMPLAIMSSLGGMITMVGTPPNITVASILAEMGHKGFGFFEFAYIGVPLSILGGAYLFRAYGFRRKRTSVYEAKPDRTQNARSSRLNREQIISISILAGVVIAMASGMINLSVASTIGAVICIVTGIITPKDAFDCIDWTTIFLFAGTLPLATALETTGAGRLIANTAIKMMGSGRNELVVLSTLFLISASLTQFMSNTAACALLAPIGLEIAIALGANFKGVLMTIGIAASSAFATPIATPPNTLIMGYANAKFTDYIRIGIPLLILSYLVCLTIVPIVWPFYP